MKICLILPLFRPQLVWSATWPFARPTTVLCGSREPSLDWSSCLSGLTRTPRGAPAWEATSSSLWCVTKPKKPSDFLYVNILNFSWIWFPFFPPTQTHPGGCAHGGNSGRLHRSSAHPGPGRPQQNCYQRAQHHSTFCPGETKPLILLWRLAYTVTHELHVNVFV